MNGLRSPATKGWLRSIGDLAADSFPSSDRAQLALCDTAVRRPGRSEKTGEESQGGLR